MPTVSRIESPCPSSGGHSTTVEFPRPYVASPRLPFGFSGLSFHNIHRGGFHVQSTIEEIEKGSAVYRVAASAETSLDKVVFASLNLAPADIDFLSGEVCLDLTSDIQAPSVYIKFEAPFVTTPKVVVFFNLLNLDSQLQERCCIGATTSQVDGGGFLLTIQSSAGTTLGCAQACWIAHPADREHIFSTSLDLPLPPIQTVLDVRYNKAIAFPSDIAFWKIPSVFVALHMLDFEWRSHLRINAFADKVTMSDLVCLIEAKSGNTPHSVGVTIIAVN